MTGPERGSVVQHKRALAAPASVRERGSLVQRVLDEGLIERVTWPGLPHERVTWPGLPHERVTWPGLPHERVLDEGELAVEQGPHLPETNESVP